MKKYFFLFLMLIQAFLFLAGAISCKTSGSGTGDSRVTVEELVSNLNGTGIPLELSLTKGKSYNHPTFAVWLEDREGHFLQTLFVTRSFGSGTFRYGDAFRGVWTPGQVRRPAALPYWSHRAGNVKGLNSYVPDAEHPVPDALTAATPKGSFLLKTRGEKENPAIVRLFLEINQTWDWNSFWTNSKFPDDQEYKTSCQPAVVYAATIDLNSSGTSYELLPVGRSSHSGADGKLYTDLETLTSALHIADKITVSVSGNKR
jgi:hypothetical protein